MTIDNQGVEMEFIPPHQEIETIDGLTAVQHKALAQPCPKCSSKLDTVGDLSDFDHDIVVCTHCDYVMFADGSTDED